MDKLIELLNNGALYIAEKAFALIDYLDFIHPIILITFFVGIFMSIHWFMPVWIAQTLWFLIFVPLLSFMISFIYIGVSTLRSDDY